MPEKRGDIQNQRRQVRENIRNLYDVVKEYWESHARDIVEQLPVIRQRLFDALRKDSIIPYDDLANYIQHWCSASTISRWVMSIEGFTMYSESVIPLLYPIQRKNNLNFSKRMLNHGGVWRSNYLWIHFYEE